MTTALLKAIIQGRLFPVAFEAGHGVTLTDVDGNTYIDLSSGIHVTNLGHCHPRVAEAVQKYAARLWVEVSAPWTENSTR